MADGNEQKLCPLTREDIDPLGDFALPVNTGVPFATFPPEKLGSGHMDVVLSDCAAANIICDTTAGTLTASTLGMLSITEDGMRINPLWTASEDGMTLTMDVYHEDCFNDRIPLTTFLSCLPEKSRGVDREVLGEAAAKALTTGEPVRGVVVARGKEAVQGRDGRIQLLFSEHPEAGAEKEDGSIDFRERGTGSNCVVEGEDIAILHPPKPGSSGYDVLGNDFPAEDGKPTNLTPGQGVTSSMNADEQVVFSSTQPGMVVVKNGVISISDVMEVPSDVDISTGNIRVRKGSILVKGTVTTGFVLEAKENVQVEVVVENATIRAGDDVTVRGGVLMEEGGLIEAGGDVKAKFFRNATIRAGGDVIADVDMVNCDVIAGGRIIASSDRGTLNGGTYVCSGADVAEIGSESGSKTSVTMGLPDAEDDDIEERKRADMSRVKEIEKFIGTEEIRKTLLMTPKVDRAIVLELYRIKMNLQERIGYLAEEKAALLKERGEALAQLKLKVRKAAHAGTSITIGNKTIKLNREELRSKFHWDPEKSGIAITGL